MQRGSEAMTPVKTSPHTHKYAQHTHPIKERSH